MVDTAGGIPGLGPPLCLIFNFLAYLKRKWTNDSLKLPFVDEISGSATSVYMKPLLNRMWEKI